MVTAQARVIGVPLPDVDTPSSILSKAFDLLRAFNSNERVMSLTELSEASGLAKSTVHRLLARLVELGAIEHHRDSYRIGIEIFRLGVTTRRPVCETPRSLALRPCTGRLVRRCNWV